MLRDVLAALMIAWIILLLGIQTGRRARTRERSPYDTCLDGPHTRPPQ